MHHFGHFDASALRPHPAFDGRGGGYLHASRVDHATESVHTGLSIDELAPAPQPKPAGQERDTFFVRNESAPQDAAPLDLTRLNGALPGHFDEGQIPPGDEGRMMGGGLKGVFLKWLIDEKFGAAHHRLLFIEYLPGVAIGLHDHAYEEAYFILSGEVEATLDGKKYVAQAGDVLWTGVGCVHAFANTGREPVRWLETFSPEPPSENVFRFMAEWEQRARDLEGS